MGRYKIENECKCEICKIVYKNRSGLAAHLRSAVHRDNTTKAAEVSAKKSQAQKGPKPFYDAVRGVFQSEPPNGKENNVIVLFHQAYAMLVQERDAARARER